ncbi:universal stress protein [Frateuria defendens]|uniref:universal stress protein n=1 Tax=Frateuria defendens TaxID=2219559 RepID=UPI0013792619|nr:universal stress protein [Frateuria defendens]
MSVSSIFPNMPMNPPRPTAMEPLAGAAAQPALDIVALCPRFPAWGPAARYAAELAMALGATLTGLYIGKPLSSASPAGVPPALEREWLAYMHDEVRAAVVAGSGFVHWASRFTPSPHWQVALGDPAEALRTVGDWSDLLVLEHGEHTRGDPSGLIASAVLSGLACILVPEAAYVPGRLERVAVAWDDTALATRALHAALPLLHRASEVVLLCSERSWEVPGSLPERLAFDARKHLVERGIVFAVEPVGQGGDAILAAASRHRADLLVMGANGKHRFNVRYLDPDTDYVLHHAGLPLFLKH